GVVGDGTLLESQRALGDENAPTAVSRRVPRDGAVRDRHHRAVCEEAGAQRGGAALDGDLVEDERCAPRDANAAAIWPFTGGRAPPKRWPLGRRRARSTGGWWTPWRRYRLPDGRPRHRPPTDLRRTASRPLATTRPGGAGLQRRAAG